MKPCVVLVELEQQFCRLLVLLQNTSRQVVSGSEPAVTFFPPLSAFLWQAPRPDLKKTVLSETSMLL